MAKARAIIKRLKAVKNIRKITRTMELIATARFKKAMERATEAAAYTKKISEIVADLSNTDLQIDHPLLKSRDNEKNVVLLVITSNRGLCGGYNSGLLRLAQKQLLKTSESDQNVDLEVSGKRGIGFLKFTGRTPSREFLQFEDKPQFDEVEEIANRYIESYTTGTIDRLEVVFTQFESASRQSAVVETLLPIGDLSRGDSSKNKTQHEEEESTTNVDYEFLPSAAEILEELVPASFKARLFKCFLDAAVSEQIARMVAMKGATENAQDMIGDLSQKYNRARQTQITSELSEIIGGAAALE